MLDPVLRPFVEAADDASAERELSNLIERQALPLAKKIVGRKLHSYRTDGRDVGADREDVVGDIMAILVERLRSERAGGGDEPIENFESYAATVAYSACAHHIRRRHPERARLKNRLRYVLSSDRRLALWTHADELVCGLVAWRGRPSEPAAQQTLSQRIDRDDREWISMNRETLARAVVARLTACAGPIGFETLVAAASDRMVEPKELADGPLPLPTVEPNHDQLIDQRRFLEQVWQEIVKLPVRQRIALLLNLRDANGAGLLWLLPVAGVATIRQIARVLEMQADEFARLWPDIPLDDASIARRLGCTRQQVINLRVSARKRLLNRVAGLISPVTDRGSGRANLRSVSASLKGRT